MKPSIRNINIEHRANLSKMEKLALFITVHVGTMGFFLIVFTWTVFWLSWNIFVSEKWRFDSYPAFVLWLFISNVIQLFLMPLIMVGQNLQGRHTEARAEADFEVNIKSETEIKTILNHLEIQNNNIKSQTELILKILSHLEKRTENKPDIN